jgi:hypothetical protein
MPSPVLTQAATIMCPHGGRATVVPKNTGQVHIENTPVLVLTDVFVIAGCVFNYLGSPAPCISIQWTAPSTLLFANGEPVLLATSVGLCIGGSGGVPAIVTPGQTTFLSD